MTLTSLQVSREILLSTYDRQWRRVFTAPTVTVLSRAPQTQGWEPCRSQQRRPRGSSATSVPFLINQNAELHTIHARLPQKKNLTFPLVLLLCPYLETLRKWLQKFYQKEISEVGGFLYLNGKIWKGKKMKVNKFSILPSLHATTSNKADFLRNYQLCVSLISDVRHMYPWSAGEPNKKLKIKYGKF